MLKIMIYTNIVKAMYLQKTNFVLKIRIDIGYFPWTLLLSENLLNVDDALSLGIYGPSTITSI